MVITMVITILYNYGYITYIAMVMVYTSIECENDCFEGKIEKTLKFKILGVVDQWGKAIIILDHI